MPDNVVLSAALSYAAKGWPVFPCGMDKKPLTTNGFYAASTDPEQIRRWWTKNPHAAIGVPTGRTSGILVIDLDVRPDGDGRETLRDLEVGLGQLPDTVMSITPSSGNHRVFLYPGDDATNYSSAAGIADHIDVRGDGGYVILPPSRIKSGEYTWELSSDPHEVSLAQLPQAWLHWLPHSPRFPANVDTTHFTLPKEIRPGERNDILFRYACQLRAKGADADQIMAALQEANAQYCTIPLRDTELRAITGSAEKYPAGSSASPSSNGRKQKPRLTMEIFSNELANAGYAIRYNVISKQFDITGESASGRHLTTEDLVVLMHDRLADQYTDTGSATLEGLLGYEAREHRYNPVLDLLKATKWDGVDRISQLYSVIGIPEDDKLSRELIRRWLLQAVAMLFNDERDPFGAEGILVLNCHQQGAGKSSLLRHLAMKPELFMDGGVIDDRDKDTSRRCFTVWICELGEIETTLKSDIPRFKALITNTMDKYRLPYGRTDVVAPRITSLAASCNTSEYLVDTTGNRRFWTVPFNKDLTIDEVKTIDALQLWAQIYAVVSILPYDQIQACFRLPKDVRDQLAVRNGEYEKLLKGEAEVRDILSLADDRNLPRKAMTVSEFKEQWPVLKPYSVQQLGVALSKAGIDTKRTHGGRRKATLPVNQPEWVNNVSPFRA